jgi:molecular chaperone GrpE
VIVGDADPGHGADDDLVDVGPADPDQVIHEADEVLDAAEAEQAAEAAGHEVDVATLVAERDEYLDALRRVKAEYENSKKRWDRERAEVGSHAARSLAEQLLPVLDACEAAVGQGATDVDPVAKSLFEVLARQGLEQVRPDGQPFDPEHHEAVMFEQGDGGEQVVAETLRTGYAWKGQVLRAAMVRVRD